MKPVINNNNKRKGLEFTQNFAVIHEKYVKYKNQRDLTKTDNTNLQSLSNDPSVKQSDMPVPNMSRPVIHPSVSLDASRQSPKEQMFTRSNCLSGNPCEAGCHIHKKCRKRVAAVNPAGIVIPNLGQRLQPQIDISDPDKSRSTSKSITGDNVRYRRLVYKAIDDDDDEEVIVVRKVTNIFKTTIYNTSKLTDSPPVVKPVTNKWPTICLLLILLPLLSGFVYLISPYASSPSSLWVWPYRPLNGHSGTSDMSTKHAINELIKEMKKIGYDFQSLKDSNNDFKSHMKSSRNEKWIKFDERVAEIEDYLAKSGPSSTITIAEIKSLIRQALAIYDADKTGQPDFALETAGGSIINHRCSMTYNPFTTTYRLFGIPFWSSSVSPRAVIQRTISPGECWPFKGSIGYLVIKLSQAIRPTGFTYQHIPKLISRDGNIDSAPKQFQIRALDDSGDQTGRVLGNYVYKDNDQPMQYFQVADPDPRPVEYIQLIILSNHGHTDYTCLYRFRVHGQRINT